MARYETSCSYCDRRVHARGLCSKHYQAWQRDPGTAQAPRLYAPTTREAFWARVSVGGPRECWHWTGTLKEEGYGNATMPWRRGTTGAHVVAWYWTHGEVPPAGMHLDHLCHNVDPDCPPGPCLHRSCVNPVHLEVVTPRENLMNGKSFTWRLLQRQFCDAGHPFSGSNLFVYENGARRCRRCHALYMREWNRTQRAKRMGA